jgi:carboxymethylenebutenolidase
MHSEKLMIEVQGETQAMPAYLAKPDGDGPFPAVIVIEEIFGVNSHIREVTERVAKEGYVAIAPDIHHRHAAGMELNYEPGDMQKGMPLIGKLTQSGFFADLEATLKTLRARRDVKGDRIGAMGFCIGGHLAFLAATGGEIKATASFYGGGIAVMGLGVPEPTVSRAGHIKGRIICFFGDQDGMIPAAQRDTIKKALEEHHIRHELVLYPGAGHAFFCDNPKRGSYRPEAAHDAWERTKRLFAEELG